MLGETYPVTIRFPLGELAKIDALAKKTRRTRATLIRHVLALAEESGVSDLRLSFGEANGGQDTAA